MIDDLVAVLEREQAKHQALPLVLYKQTPEARDYTGAPDLTNEQFLGWYSYNNAPDYEAFTALLLYRAAQNLQRPESSAAWVRENHADRKFVKVANNIFAYRSDRYMLNCGLSTDWKSLVFYSPILATEDDLILPPTTGEQTSVSLNNDYDAFFPIVVPETQTPRQIQTTRLRDNALDIGLHYDSSFSVTRRYICKPEQVVILELIKNRGESTITSECMRLQCSQRHIDKIDITSRGSETLTERQKHYSTVGADCALSCSIQIPPKSSMILRAVVSL
ncbi:MAG TPA: hypothetical protein EYG51_11325 [Pseudomonadales bacterium]|nr:hypothetical protein [Pseudomonadales bacterium]